MDFLASVSPEQQCRIAAEEVIGTRGRALEKVALKFGLRADEDAIATVKHPERSPFAMVGPRNAPFGNDPKFLANSKLRPREREAERLNAPVPWRADGGGLSEHVIELGMEFGYV